MVPPGALFGVIPTWIGVYLVSTLAFGIAGYFLYQRVFRLVILGRPSNRFDQPVRRILGAMPYIFGQRKVLQRVSIRRDRAGLFHFFIFWGFLSFSFSYFLFIFLDVAWRPLSATVLTDTGVKIFVFYLDVLAVVFLVVLTWAAVRRWGPTPRRLSFDLTQGKEAAIILALIAMLMLFTLLAEAFYVASGGTGPHSAAPIGAALGDALVGAGIGVSLANGLQAFFWWAHLGVILGFAIYIPLSKHMHMIAAPINFVTRNLEARGTLSTPADLETAEVFGAHRIQDFTQRQLLDGYACSVCGRCSDVCPANFSGKILSPMHIVENLKEHILDVGPALAGGEDLQKEKPLIGPWIPAEALWDCLTCGACVQECPVGVEHIDTIVDMRRYLVMEKAEMPESGMNALVSMEQRGHPWRGTTFTRTDWAEGLNIKTLADHPEAEVLFWVGCTAALEQRSQSVARSMASVLKRAGVDFAILGNEETCTGDPARRMGNEYLYQTLATQNIETFKRYDVKTIVTICPHCFNTIKNEYPHLGGNYEVMHYSEFVADLIAQGRIRPLVEIKTTIAYHDSCYLGRHNDVYEAPRQIANAIPGLKLVEFDRCRSQGFCCGAGGGHMWMEESRGRRVNHIRTEQYLDTEADIVAVSCPFCLQMFEEGIGSLGSEDPSGDTERRLEGKRALDLIEILDESLGEAKPAD
ncbi:MAG: (Fe-S)-binding protein [Chloroflexi bacterium]|nr:(Fe-S)-binding protein [Chloroflexota bacterium]